MPPSESEPEQLAVLMVCLGNICRSPMAEAVFRHTAEKHSLLSRFSKIDSAGTAAYHTGSFPDSRSVDCCRSHGVDVDHSARQVRKRDYDAFDYILAMDKENLRNLQDRQPSGSKAKVMMLGDFNGNGKKGVVVEDPYYGGADGFETNFKQVTKFSENFLKEILGAEL